MNRIVHIAALLAAVASGMSAAHADSVIPAAEYVAAAERALRERMRPMDGRIELRPRGSYADLRIPAERARVRVRELSKEIGDQMVVWIDVHDASRVQRRIPVHFEVRWFKAALVASRHINAGTPLLPEMFELREADVAAIRGAAVTSFAELSGMRARHELGSGRVLARASMEPRPPVEAGERIRVTASVGHIVVATTAIAERDGFNGDRIAARLLDGQQSLRVEVVGENLARVHGDGY